MRVRTFYEVLHVPTNASSEVIRQSFDTLIFESDKKTRLGTHKKSDDSPELLFRACTTLIDAEKRKRYDLLFVRGQLIIQTEENNVLDFPERANNGSVPIRHKDKVVDFNNYTDFKNKANSSRKKGQKNATNSKVVIAMSLMIILACVFIIRYELTGERILSKLFEDHHSYSGPTVSEAVKQDTDSLALQQPSEENVLPENGTVFIGQEILDNFSNNPNQYAPFSVTAGDYGNNYYIKLKNAETNQDSIAFFLKNGETVQIKVPLGVYTFCYATGNTWQGTDKFFGYGTAYYQADELMTFYVNGNQIMGRKVYLTKTSAGNMPEKSISSSDF